MKLVGILDYGVGNVHSFQRLCIDANIPFKVVKDSKDLDTCHLLILPGVGSFDDVVTKLKSSSFYQSLQDYVLNKKTPIIGVCIGMQVMCETSEEGKLPGLGWIENSKVVRLPASLKFIPNMGPRDVVFPDTTSLNGGYYFLHSFYCSVPNQYVWGNALIENSDYFTAAFRHKNIWGAQFHPEKSHNKGIDFIRFFYESN